MNRNFILVALFSTYLASCGAESDGHSNPEPAAPEVTATESVQTVNQNEATEIVSNDQAYTIAGLYGLSQDNMIELFANGEYRFYVKNPSGEDYYIEQGEFTVVEDKIDISPTYTTCMNEGSKFSIKSYKFSMTSPNSIAIEGVDFPAIAGVDASQIKEESCTPID